MRPTPPDAALDTDDIAVARVTSAWGLRGDMRIEVLTDVADRFVPDNILYIGRVPHRVERSRSVRGGVLIKLDGVGDRTSAESLVGSYLTVPRSQVPPLAEGSYYHFEIIGMAVVSAEGDRLGEVTEIIATGANDVYVVRGPGGKELLVPALADVIAEVDVAGNKMVVRQPEGFL